MDESLNSGIVTADGICDGWLRSARRVESPNYNNRPAWAEIDLLVIHSISLPPGEFGGDQIDRFFQNCLDQSEHPYFSHIADLKVSAHLLIDRRGLITQYVNFNQRAWHAGVSSFCGREQCNDYSIGIELEGDDDTPYTERQYRALILTTRQLRKEWPGITPGRMVGHCDIAPGRKTDPGRCFDWRHYRGALGPSI